MTILIIIAVYTLGVFAAREMNRRSCMSDENDEPTVGFWFLSWITVFIMGIVFICVRVSRNNWFTGKYWEYGKKNEK